MPRKSVKRAYKGKKPKSRKRCQNGKGMGQRIGSKAASFAKELGKELGKEIYSQQFKRVLKPATKKQSLVSASPSKLSTPKRLAISRLLDKTPNKVLTPVSEIYTPTSIDSTSKKLTF